MSQSPDSSDSPLNFESVIWTGTQLLVTELFGNFFTSPDGKIWTPRYVGLQGRSATRTGTQFVSVGESGVINTSPDGVTWTRRYPGTAKSLFSVTWTGNQIVAVGDPYTVLTSPDGIAWTLRNSGVGAYLFSVIWAGGQLVAVGNFGGILTAPEDPSSILSRSERRRVYSLRQSPSYLFVTPPYAWKSRKTHAAVFGATGSKVAETWSANNREIEIPIGNLARGRYLFEAQSEGLRIAEPFEVTR
jgi:hypothetical protein